MLFAQLAHQAGWDLDVTRLSPHHERSVYDQFVDARFAHQKHRDVPGTTTQEASRTWLPRSRPSHHPGDGPRGRSASWGDDARCDDRSAHRRPPCSLPRAARPAPGRRRRGTCDRVDRPRARRLTATRRRIPAPAAYRFLLARNGTPHCSPEERYNPRSEALSEGSPGVRWRAMYRFVYRDRDHHFCPLTCGNVPMYRLDRHFGRTPMCVRMRACVRV